ncbi:MAG: hypothetical protein ACI83H_000451 [Glaciecola sp.]|jgi:hypothetical protein
MKKQYITLKTVNLKNNCPECYSNEGLKLSFEQEFVETNLYKSITNNTRHQLDCTTCDTAIYPARWTDDIERIADYHRKTFEPKSKSIKLKKIAWIIFITIDIIILMIILYISGVFN